MNSIPLKKSAILPRIQGIQEDLVVLRKTAKMSLKAFEEGPYFGDANFRLHRILEGIFNIGNHLLARLPGASKGMTRYGDIAENLGKHGLVPKLFAQNVLKNMAGYRNRLVHGYAQITPKETLSLLKHHLDDVENFLVHIKKILKTPGKFKLSVEN